MSRALCLTLWLFCTAAWAENEIFSLAVVTRDGRLSQRLRGLFARQLPGVEVQASKAIARYRQSPHLIEALCGESAYYLHAAGGALIDRGCLSETEIAPAIYALRTAMARNQAYYAPGENNPLLLLDMALAAAAAARYAESLSILARPELRLLPASARDVEQRLRQLLARK